ncbi:hypothetical protein ABKN59_006085 [Abortiporus biennis]
MHAKQRAQSIESSLSRVISEDAAANCIEEKPALLFSYSRHRLVIIRSTICNCLYTVEFRNPARIFSKIIFCNATLSQSFHLKLAINLWAFIDDNLIRHLNPTDVNKLKRRRSVTRPFPVITAKFLLISEDIVANCEHSMNMKAWESLHDRSRRLRIVGLVLYWT